MSQNRLNSAFKGKIGVLKLADEQQWELANALREQGAIEAVPEYLIGDRAYDSDPPDEPMRKQGTEMISP